MTSSNVDVDANENTALLTVPDGSDEDSDNRNDFLDDGDGDDLTSSRSSSVSSSSQLLRYDWREYAPKRSNRRIVPFLRWCVVGGASYAPQSDRLIHKNLDGLARCLVLLRQYQIQYGMPHRGGSRDQEFVLRAVYTGLFTGGAPIWAISPVMERACEGLTGHPQVTWMMLPRLAFAQDPASGATYLFPATRKFDFARLDAMEALVVRLCSYATNTRGSNVVPSRLPTAKELTQAAGGGLKHSEHSSSEDQASLARKILVLSSRAESLFYFANMQDGTTTNSQAKITSDVTFSSSPAPANSLDRRERWARLLVSNDNFWKVTANDRELFSRLATVDALQRLDRINKEYKTLYPAWMWALFRGLSSAGAAAFWFKGSWQG